MSFRRTFALVTVFGLLQLFVAVWLPVLTVIVPVTVVISCALIDQLRPRAVLASFMLIGLIADVWSSGSGEYLLAWAAGGVLLATVSIRLDFANRQTVPPLYLAVPVVAAMELILLLFNGRSELLSALSFVLVSMVVAALSSFLLDATVKLIKRVA